ncbi:MAG: hypothetical protein HYT70_03650 [Candidatus Aenigmarchaeota archaeon]|nr:hypothetical protein [Candidatus Aenigmarchaeota archaeon]
MKYITAITPANKVHGLFLRDWNNIKEASALYNKKYKRSGQNQPTIVRFRKSDFFKQFVDKKKIAKNYPNIYANKRIDSYKKSLMRYRIRLEDIVYEYILHRLERKKNSTYLIRHTKTKEKLLRKIESKWTEEFKAKGRSELKRLFEDEKIRNSFVSLYSEENGLEAFLENIIQTCFFIHDLYLSLLEIRLNWNHPFYRSNAVKIGREIYSKIKSTAFIKAIRYSLTSDDYNRFFLSFLMQEETANNKHELLLGMARNQTILKKKGIKAWAELERKKINLKYAKLLHFS